MAFERVAVTRGMAEGRIEVQSAVNIGRISDNVGHTVQNRRSDELITLEFPVIAGHV